MSHHYLACDLGAESGRLMAGSLLEGRLRLAEIHRFPNGPVTHEASLHWDISRLFAELKEGLRLATQCGSRFDSISTDSWGVDYLLVDAAGSILSPVYHYRDSRTEIGVKRAHSRISQQEIYRETGIQFMPLNTIYQLASEDPQRLKNAHRLLMIADAFNYLLSGVDRIEASNASTTALYNPRRHDWSARLLSALDIPTPLFPRIVPSGTRLGPIRAELCADTRLRNTEVIATCSHDTGAAVAAVPVQEEGDATAGGPPDWAYLSSGTWSLLGAELTEPQLNDAAMESNFTNEIGYGNTVRLLKNIAGLWLVQECRREWNRQGLGVDYSELAALAAAAEPFRSFISPGDSRFVAPGDMPGRIRAYCAESGQSIPQTQGAIVRCCLESLALTYAETLRQLEKVLGTRFRRLHAVGGGSQNTLLNQFTADACGIPVYAGPVEATAIGNVMIQALTLGHVNSLKSARRLVHNSFAVRVFEPGESSRWREAGKAVRSIK